MKMLPNLIIAIQSEQDHKLFTLETCVMRRLSQLECIQIPDAPSLLILMVSKASTYSIGIDVTEDQPHYSKKSKRLTNQSKKAQFIFDRHL